MKKFIAALLCAAAAACCTPAALADGDENIPVYLNGAALEFDAAPRIVNDRTLVPMRTIFEALGYEVSWDEAAGQITASHQSGSSFWGMGLSMIDIIQMQLNSNLLKVSTVQYLSTDFTRHPISSYESTIPLDCTPQLYEDRTFVPLRAIAETTGCTVTWNEDENAVYITTGADGTGVQQYTPSSNEVFL